MLEKKGPELKEKSLTISHTEHKTSPIQTPHFNREKEWGYE